jgi:anti-sigma B factor antagonist
VGPPEDLSDLDVSITTVKTGERAYVITVAGELDLYTTPRLVAELEAVAPDGPEVVLDLDGVTFIDSTGLGTILLGVRKLRDAGGGLAIVCANESTGKLLGMVGIDRVAPVFATTDRAFEHLVGSVVLRELESE